MFGSSTQPLTPTRLWLARGVAVVADALEIALFPSTVEGVFSPLDAAIDIVTAIVLISLVGWHIAFLPSFIVKALPFADMAPTWTIAVFVATGGRAKTNEPAFPVPVSEKSPK